MMKKTDPAASPAAVLGFPVLAGLLAALVSLAVFAAVLLSGAAGNGAVVPMALSALAIGCVCASFLAARRAGGSRMLWALAAGGCLFACLIVLSLAWAGQPVSPARMAADAVTALLSSCAGGLAGAGVRKKRKRRRSR